MLNSHAGSPGTTNAIGPINAIDGVRTSAADGLLGAARSRLTLTRDGWRIVLRTTALGAVALLILGMAVSVLTAGLGAGSGIIAGEAGSMLRLYAGTLHALVGWTAGVGLIAMLTLLRATDLAAVGAVVGRAAGAGVDTTLAWLGAGLERCLATPAIAAEPAEAVGEEPPPPLLHLARMRLHTVARLADVARTFASVEVEAEPLLNLVADLDAVQLRFADNLARTMRPLAEYADRRDENLMTLAARMQQVCVPLDVEQSVDVAAERDRIAEIRAQHPRQQSLLLDQFEIERRAIDAALAVFDDQVARLEAQLTAARLTAEGISDAMRSGEFARTIAFLRRRAECFDALATHGISTPQEIADALPSLTAMIDDTDGTMARSPYLRSVIAVLGGERARTTNAVA